MTAKHQTPEYQRNARIIRDRVKAAHRAGRPVACWRCAGAIAPGQPFDVGHMRGAIGSSLQELAPEHRHRTAGCIGNRAHGGAQGAAKTNARHTPTVQPKQTATWKL